MKRVAIACALALSSQAFAAETAAQLLQACQSLKRQEDRNVCLVAAVKAVAPQAAAAAPAAPQPRPEVMAATDSIMKTLRKMDGATSIGINMHDYSALVRDSSADIDEALRVVPDGDFKSAVTEAEQAYIDANTLWASSFSLRFRGLWMDRSSELLQKYGIDVAYFDSGNSLSYNYNLDTAAFLVPIWARARNLSEQASTLSTDPSRKTAQTASTKELKSPIFKVLPYNFQGGAYAAPDLKAERVGRDLAGRSVYAYAQRDDWYRVSPKGEPEQWLPVSVFH